MINTFWSLYIRLDSPKIVIDWLWLLLNSLGTGGAWSANTFLLNCIHIYKVYYLVFALSILYKQYAYFAPFLMLLLVVFSAI